MPRPWPILLSIGALTFIVFAFFLLRLKPVVPKTDDVADDGPVAGSLAEPTVTFVNPSRGPEDARVTLVTFGDFQCDACKQMAESLDIVRRTYPEDVRVVWKDMPNEAAHPLATPAAIAAHCADRQGKFWEYHDSLFDRQSYLSEDELRNAGIEVGLDMNAFARCYDAADTLAVVRKDYEEGLALGILATPTVFVGADSYAGALSISQLSQLIQDELSN